MRQRGFSLIELVVTVTVLAVLMMAIAPSISGWLDNTRIRNAASSLQDGLQTARSEAIRRNQNVSFWLVSLTNPAVLDNSCALSNTSGSWVVSINSPINHCADAPSTSAAPMLVAARPVGDGGGKVAISAALSPTDATAATSVTFDGFGRVSNAASAIGVITVTGPSSTGTYRPLQVRVTTTGQVRMCDDAADVGDPRKC